MRFKDGSQSKHAHRGKFDSKAQIGLTKFLKIGLTISGVLEMYRSGQFHIPDGSRSCASVMRRDFEYWGIDELDLEACCALKYYPEIDVCRYQISLTQAALAQMDKAQGEKYPNVIQVNVLKLRNEI